MLRSVQWTSQKTAVVWIASLFLLTGASIADDQLPAEGKIASVNGFQMYYEIHGEGEPLVLLHGFFGSGEFWQPLVAELAKDYRLVIPDLRKHGRSTDPGGIFTHRQAAKDVFALLDQLQIKECRAIGFSTGGMTLLHMATSQPNRIKSMVLIGAASYLPTVARNYRQITFDDFSIGPLVSLKKFHVRGDDQIRELLRCWYAFENNFDDMNFTPPFLSTIKASTLIVYGDRDEYFPVEIALEMYRSIPDSYLWVVPNGRHVPDFENPKQFVIRFREFLQGKWKLPTALPEEASVSAERVGALSQSMQTLVNQRKISGGVTMLARHGKVVHNEAVGYLDFETKRPMPRDAIFRIASMTKPITSVAVMTLWEQGKLELDDPLSKYLTAFESPTVLVSVDSLDARPARGGITIRHLLTHTSGLSYEFAEPLGPLYHKHGIHCGSCTVEETLEDMINKLGPLPLLFDPGEQWHYGMNYAVLGRIVEVVSEMPFDRYVEQKICRPLRMHDTHFKVPDDKLDRLAAAYVPSGDSIRRLKAGEMLKWNLTDLGGGDILMSCDYPYSTANRCVLGGGNLCSTPADYMRFCQMLLNEGELDGIRLLRADTVKMMTANQVGDLRGEEGYGYGFGITPDTADIPEQLRASYYWYGGWTTSFRISPRGDWILVTMTQVAWNDLTPKWLAEYEQLAADSIMD